MSTFTRDLDGLADDLERLAAGFTNQKLLNRLGLAQIRLMKKRTREGKDVHGRDFAPYSARYAELKAEANLPTSPVNLQYGVRREKRRENAGRGKVKASLYDSMLDYVDHVVANDLSDVTVLITKEEKRKIAGYHSFEGAGRSKVIREFWGASEAEMDQLQDIVSEDIAELLRTADLTA